MGDTRQALRETSDALLRDLDVLARPMQAILAEWREAERHAAAATPGSADAAESEALVARLRDEYRQAREAAREE